MHCRLYPDLHSGAFRNDLTSPEPMSDSPLARHPFLLDCSGIMLDLSSSPAIMGIINLTPDSFYDGGTYSENHLTPDIDKALDAALSMIQAGACIIDVGGESTRPGAEQVTTEEEIKRTVPFISRLRKKSDVLISVDTYKSAVAEEALKAGAGMVNDISGFTFDTCLPSVCSRYRCGTVLMHTPLRPGSMQWSHETGSSGDDIVTDVLRFLERSVTIARQHGISSIVVDPGFGFGKSVEENFTLLDRLDELHSLGCPVLAGLSRKSFLGQATRDGDRQIPPPSERLEATIAANTIALMRGASILRVHDVRAAAHARAVVLSCRRAQ